MTSTPPTDLGMDLRIERRIVAVIRVRSHIEKSRSLNRQRLQHTGKHGERSWQQIHLNRSTVFRKKTAVTHVLKRLLVVLTVLALLGGQSAAALGLDTNVHTATGMTGSGLSCRHSSASDASMTRKAVALDNTHDSSCPMPAVDCQMSAACVVNNLLPAHAAFQHGRVTYGRVEYAPTSGMWAGIPPEPLLLPPILTPDI